VRQMADASGEVVHAAFYSPYGEGLSTAGAAQTGYGYTNEYTSQGLVNLRSRLYSPSTGRFLTKDTWHGNYNYPQSLNPWNYGYNNPVKYADPSGLWPKIYGVQIDDAFTNEEKQLIVETIADYATFLGGGERFSRNLALSDIKQGWVTYSGAYNAQYNQDDHSITLQPGWYSPVITVTPSGKILIIFDPPCIEKMLGFPEGSLPTNEISAKFVLAHEMTHAFAFGDPSVFKSFTDNVDLPWSIFAGLSSNPIIRRNAGRSLADEVFADVIPAYMYSKGLLNQQMSDWVETKLSDTLK
jgi:RHS repeat-associated protein